MKLSFKIYIILLFITAYNSARAQQQVMYTQYMFNELAINPAYAGSHKTLSLTAIAREQWVGLDGAPSTQTISGHMPIENKNIGVGLMMMYDRIGVTSQTGVYASSAYKIDFDNNLTLSMGLSAGFTYYNAELSQINSSDVAFANGDVRATKPNVGVGFYLSHERFYAGLSSPQILELQFDNDNPDSDSRIARHYFLTGGYLFDVSPMVKIKPSTLLKYVQGAPLNIDLNATVILQEMFWVGLSWRSFDSFDGLLQFQATDNLLIGYSYDFLTTSDLKRVNSGSHEIMLNYRFNLGKGKLRPNYF
ncbi:type IX secretion system membrane protein PorP/SprF [Marivirga atlantica]|jgi:type IX secretion system PorP/SprF family membrane protein|uniref:Type IX secretion system membrane protein PorP/SprF n=1 Tax=Marivirga atlantica TaxID=1548457 RepID=A0A937DEX9_9BACT|nr:type IX secretion system membrane protein PorP/SprF [Marivirga atlantica]MBL0765662.1 type IX secretion system membrane protein PorP/SprF [Marivirga atlantica]